MIDQKPITLDDMERMAQAAVDQDDGEGAVNDALPRGFPPLLALGLIQRVRRAEAALRELMETARDTTTDEAWWWEEHIKKACEKAEVSVEAGKP